MGNPKAFLTIPRKEAGYRPIHDRILDFSEVEQTLNSNDRRQQASRCMDCGVPFCHWACPLGNKAPEWNDALYKGDWEQAYRLLNSTNDFPEFTGRICPALCEKACVLNLMDHEPTTNREDECAIVEHVDSPEFTADVDATGVLRILEAIRQCGLEKTCRMYQASTSELYGKVEEVPQNENTPFHPYSPYAVAKQYGFWIVKEYREAYDMFCCSGILFNHESERRGETFVTRKITLAAARIKQGKQDKLYLGNLDSLRDWGYAKDYVECMWLILQADKPEDFVIATGKQHSVREFAQLAFHYVGIELKWEGKDENEKGICVEGPEELIGKTLVEVSPDFYRPTDVVNLWGDPTKAKAKLNWNPNTTSFEDLVKIMVESDMAKVAAEDAGQKVRCNLAEYLEKGIVK